MEIALGFLLFKHFKDKKKKKKLKKQLNDQNEKPINWQQEILKVLKVKDGEHCVLRQNPSKNKQCKHQDSMDVAKLTTVLSRIIESYSKLTEKETEDLIRRYTKGRDHLDCSTCLEVIQYFTEYLRVFSGLDKDDDGMLSYEEVMFFHNTLFIENPVKLEVEFFQRYATLNGVSHKGAIEPTLLTTHQFMIYVMRINPIFDFLKSLPAFRSGRAFTDQDVAKLAALGLK